MLRVIITERLLTHQIYKPFEDYEHAHVRWFHQGYGSAQRHQKLPLAACCASSESSVVGV